MNADEPVTLNRIYTVPDPFTSFEEHERHGHLDLPRQPRADLLRERERIRLRLLLDDEPDVWLLVRLKKITDRLDGRP